MNEQRLCCEDGQSRVKKDKWRKKKKKKVKLETHTDYMFSSKILCENLPVLKLLLKLQHIPGAITFCKVLTVFKALADVVDLMLNAGLFYFYY